jgi:signal peptidase II
MVYIISIITFGLDRITKVLITNEFALYESRPVIGSIMSFTYVENTGAAFSILQGQRIFFIIMTVVMLGIIFYLYYKMLEKDFWTTLSVGLIIGGALGNFYDRLLYGSVIDFIDFYFFPVFNIADSALVVGTALLALIIWKTDDKSEETKN